PCTGALRTYLVFDIFSDDPKSTLTLCERHDGYYGSPSEGYFTCADCGRVMVENYTWELYYHDTPDGRLCLPCAAKRHIEDEDNWLPLTDEDIAVVTFEVIHHARHVLGVEMPVPKEIHLFESVTLDSSTGGMLRGFSTADPT